MAEEQQFVLAVVAWSYGIDCNCQLSIECNGKVFEVILSPTISSSQGGTIEELLLKRLSAALKSADENEEFAVQEEIADVVCETRLPTFKQLAPSLKISSSLIDLHSFLYPETFYFQLVTINGKLHIVERDDGTLEAREFTLNAPDSRLPRIRSQDIQVLKSFRNKNITKVLVHGHERCCKIAGRMTEQAVPREFDCLRKIYAADIRYLRVPKLVGLVQSSSNGAVIGILEEYIYTPPEIGQKTLQHIDVKNVPDERRAKWVSQVQETVETLHRIGIVWGDGKADNVLIDVNDDTWLIDFGGGWTNGWVDAKLAGTAEGDNQAVGKIARFLGM
jgi:serine/threonine protein kinase